MSKTAYVDYQERAAQFSVGSCVRPFFDATLTSVGRVTAVWSAIGMVDVEWPSGSERVPVEDLVLCAGLQNTPPASENVPGGASSVPVPEGPVKKQASIRRVAEAYVKKALYWVDADRHFRATKAEIDGGSFTCPKCKESVLKKAIYRRRNGMSERLLGCPTCLFLIERDSVINHPEL